MWLYLSYSPFAAMFVFKFTVGLLALMLVSSAWAEELTEVSDTGYEAIMP